ncbi:hypothetical protein BN1183_AY_00530 [Pantoea ananatis]|nr:hypothetical protein BN1183_AY_00530 [Pantoea ananatis]
MLTRWIKSSTLALVASMALSQSVQAATPLVLATKSFTEQHILSAMTVMWLQKKALRSSRNATSPPPSVVMP